MTVAAIQQAKAKTFLDLHRGQDLFILPNAWDAASARIFERAAFSAIVQLVRGSLLLWDTAMVSRFQFVR